MNYFDLVNYLENVDSLRPSVFDIDMVTPPVFDLNMKKIMILNETTGQDAVAFIPAHLGVVKARVADLAKKKKDWKIEVLEQDDNKEVQFEDSLRVIVPNEHWDSFCSIFDNSVSNNSYLNLTSLLNETMEEEMQDLRRELRVALAHLYDESEFRKLNQSSGTWKWRFGVVSYDTRKKNTGIVVSQENKAEGIQKLYGRLLEVYGDDRGNLEMIIEAIKDKRPLNAYDIFKGYDFLYGTRIHSRYQGVNLYFEALVDPSYHLSETIFVPKSDDLLDKIQEESREVKVVRSVIYPKGGVFTPRFLRVLSDTIEDLDTEEEAEEDD